MATDPFGPAMTPENFDEDQQQRRKPMFGRAPELR
jgi:hypothetical protein